MSVFQTHKEERVLQSNRFICFFVPREDSVRAYLSVGNNWRELYKTDFSNGVESNSFGYDPINAAVTVDSDLLGNKLRVEYDHDGDVNPGVIDVIPVIMGQWVKQQNYMILDGLHVRKSVINGVVAGDAWAMHVASGTIAYEGEIYAVSENIYSLHHFGGSHGVNNITAFIMFFNKSQFKSASGTKLLGGPLIVKSKAHDYADDGGGLDSALNEAYVTLQDQYNLGPSDSAYLECLRGGVLSLGSEPPQLFVHYPKRYRALTLQI